ncbi:PaaI family thioesterase [Rufibacter glacialis]|uniref:PaaI family thioesterase n=1 Tax=Rufibacter glacialis TaxID=1259555 RepID=A0A5M8Q9F5_9BACT|nr:PaaI family thioesterase [Rufibacter glacialis]KAA6431778.1 PaaI family thioesterase [Rufibacter glacialis]GGK81649.1 thioesterase [Rufibacter glacialis]
MLKTFNPDFTNTVKEKLQRQFYMHLLEFEIETVEIGLIEGTLVLQEKHKQHKGFAHGGVIATLADIVMGFAAVTLVPADHHVVTADLKISYLSPGVGTALVAKGWVLKQGKRLNFCEAEIFSIDGQGQKNLVAKASATMATLPPTATSPQN